MSKRIYAVVYKNGQVDAWSTNQGPPSMPYVHEWEVQSEIDSLQAEIERLKKENKRLNDYIKQTSPRVDVDLCYTQNARYRMALETIATETIEPAYSTQIATRWRMIAREAVGEVLGE